MPTPSQRGHTIDLRRALRILLPAWAMLLSFFGLPAQAQITAQYVRLEALSEVNGKPYTSMAEFNLFDSTGATLSRAGWTVSVDSQEIRGEDGAATNAIDGDGDSFWHTDWFTTSPPPPHTFTVNLGGPRNIAGFRYLPVSNGSDGRITDWRFYTSIDGTTWTQVGEGTFNSSLAEKSVTFNPAPTSTTPTLAAVANRTSNVGTAASLTLNGSGASGDTLTYSATGLPTGLSIAASTGAISGTPTTAGTYNVTATVSNGRRGDATQSFIWTIAPAPAPGAVQYVRLEALSEVNGKPYTSMAEFNLLDSTGATLARTGWTVSVDSQETAGENGGAGTNAIDGRADTYWHTNWFNSSPPPPHTFTVNLGGFHKIGGFRYLPASDGSDGHISAWRFYTSTDGTNWTQVGEGTFTFSLAEKSVTFAPAPTSAIPTLSAVVNQTGNVGTAASLTLSGSGASGDTLTYTANGLPAGLSIAAATGVISGTPTTATTYNVTVVVNDGRGGTASRSFSWTIASAANVAPTLAAVANQTGNVGTATSLTLSGSGSGSGASGDTLTYSATGLPAGLNIAAATGGISGTPTTAATYDVTVQVSDSRGGTASRSFNWTIAAQNLGSLSGAVDAATMTVDLAAQGTTDWAHWGTGGVPGMVRRASGGSVISAYTMVGEAEPIAYDDDTRPMSWIEGTPTASASADTNGIYVFGYTHGFQLTVPADTTERTVKVYVGGWNSSGSFTASLNDGSAADYSETTEVGTGQYNRTYTVTYRAASASQHLTLRWVQASFDGNVTLNAVALSTGVASANTAPTLATVTNQTGDVGSTANLILSGSDADGDSLVYSATGLPAGLSIAAATGVISGTPTTATTYNVTVVVNDGRGGTASRSFSWTIAPAADAAPTLAAVANQTGNVGTAASLTLNGADVSGDTLTYSATGLPAGLSIAAATGVVSGTPTAAAAYNVTVTVSNRRGATASRSFIWTISAAPTTGGSAFQCLL